MNRVAEQRAQQLGTDPNNLGGNGNNRRGSHELVTPAWIEFRLIASRRHQTPFSKPASEFGH
jgi:hypothetical protein